MSQGFTGAILESAISYPSLAAAGTTTLNNADWHVVVITTSPPLATGTIKMCAAPFDGQLVDIRADGTITGLNVSANVGQSVVNAPTTLTAGTVMTAVYRASNTTWYF